MPFTLFPSTVPNMGALGTGPYVKSPAEQMREQLAATELWEQSVYGQRRAQQEEAANSRAYELAEREYDLKRDGLKTQRAQIAISRGQAEADTWYKQQSIALSREELGFKYQQHQDNLAFNREELAFRGQQHKDTMGLEGLKLGADLRAQPRDLFRSLWYESASQGDPNQTANVAAWANAFGPQQTGAASTPYQTGGPGTVANLAAAMTGQGGVGSQAVGTAGAQPGAPTGYGSPGVQATLGGLAAFGANPQQAQPGYLEGKSPEELAAIQGGLVETGYIPGITETKYRRTRLPGGIASAFAA